MLKISGEPESPNEGGVFIKIYDEPLSRKEGACFKIYGERLSPTAGACLRYMKTYGPSLRRVQVPYIEAQKTIKNTQKTVSLAYPCDSYRFFAIEGQKTIKNTQKNHKKYPKKT